MKGILDCQGEGVDKFRSQYSSHQKCPSEFWCHVLQIFLHLDIFRRSFREITDHYCIPGLRCVFCALKVSFEQFRTSHDCLSNPLGHTIQSALANESSAIEYKTVASNNLLNRALQTIDCILDGLHQNLDGTRSQGILCLGSNCISHRKMRLNIVMSHDTMCCQCRTPINRQPQNLFKEGVLESISALRKESTYYQTALPISVKGLVKSFSQLRGRQGSDYCNKHAGQIMGKALIWDTALCKGCGNRVQLSYQLLNSPDTLMVGLEWDTNKPTLNEIHETIFAIGSNVKLNEIFHKCADPRARRCNFRLRGLVTIQDGAYHTYFYHSSLEMWICFDDTNVEEVGHDWEDVVRRCLDNNCQPLIIIYSNPESKPVKADPVPPKISFQAGYKVPAVVMGNVAYLKQRLAKSRLNFKSMQSLLIPSTPATSNVVPEVEGLGSGEEAPRILDFRCSVIEGGIYRDCSKMYKSSVDLCCDKNLRTRTSANESTYQSSTEPTIIGHAATDCHQVASPKNQDCESILYSDLLKCPQLSNVSSARSPKYTKRAVPKTSKAFKVPQPLTYRVAESEDPKNLSKSCSDLCRDDVSDPAQTIQNLFDGEFIVVKRTTPTLPDDDVGSDLNVEGRDPGDVTADSAIKAAPGLRPKSKIPDRAKAALPTAPKERPLIACELFKKFLLLGNGSVAQRRDSGYLTSGDQNSTSSNSSSVSVPMNPVAAHDPEPPSRAAIEIVPDHVISQVKPLPRPVLSPPKATTSTVSGSSSLSAESNSPRSSISSRTGETSNTPQLSADDGDSTLVRSKSPANSTWPTTPKTAKFVKSRYPAQRYGDALISKVDTDLSYNYDHSCEAGSSLNATTPSESFLLDSETKSDTFRCKALCSEASALVVQAEKSELTFDYSGAICFCTNAASRARQAMDHHRADPDTITHARVLYNKCVTLSRESQSKLLLERSNLAALLPSHKTTGARADHKIINTSFTGEQQQGLKDSKSPTIGDFVQTAGGSFEGEAVECHKSSRTFQDSQVANLYGTLPRTKKGGKSLRESRLVPETLPPNELLPPSKPFDRTLNCEGGPRKEIRRSEITLKFGRKEEFQLAVQNPTLTNTATTSRIGSIYPIPKRRSEGLGNRVGRLASNYQNNRNEGTTHTINDAPIGQLSAIRKKFVGPSSAGDRILENSRSTRDVNNFRFRPISNASTSRISPATFLKKPSTPVPLYNKGPSVLGEMSIGYNDNNSERDVVHYQTSRGPLHNDLRNKENKQRNYSNYVGTKAVHYTTDTTVDLTKSDTLLSPKSPKSYHFLEELSRNLESEIDLMHKSLSSGGSSSGRMSSLSYRSSEENFNGRKVPNGPSFQRTTNPSSTPDHVTTAKNNNSSYISYSPVPEIGGTDPKFQENREQDQKSSRKLKLLEHIYETSKPIMPQSPSLIPNPHFSSNGHRTRQLNDSGHRSTDRHGIKSNVLSKPTKNLYNCSWSNNGNGSGINEANLAGTRGTTYAKVGADPIPKSRPSAVENGKRSALSKSIPSLVSFPGSAAVKVVVTNAIPTPNNRVRSIQAGQPSDHVTESNNLSRQSPTKIPKVTDYDRVDRHQVPGKNSIGGDAPRQRIIMASPTSFINEDSHSRRSSGLQSYSSTSDFCRFNGSGFYKQAGSSPPTLGYLSRRSETPTKSGQNLVDDGLLYADVRQPNLTREIYGRSKECSRTDADNYGRGDTLSDTSKEPPSIGENQRMCQLCHKSQIQEYQRGNSGYCEDCNFYLAKFKRNR